MINRRSFSVPGDGPNTRCLEFVGAYSDRTFELQGDRLTAVRNWRSQRRDGLGCFPLRLANREGHEVGFLAGDGHVDLSWKPHVIALPSEYEIKPEEFDDLWDAHVAPRLSTYHLGATSEAYGQHLFGTGQGREFHGVGQAYAEFVDDDYALRGVVLFDDGAKLASLLPVPPGCSPVEETSATALLLDDASEIRAIPQSDFEALWRNYVCTTRYFRGRVREEFRWRLADGTVAHGPGWAYQRVQGRWIVDEYFIAEGAQPGSVRRESPTQMNGFLSYEEIAEGAFPVQPDVA